MTIIVALAFMTFLLGGGVGVLVVGFVVLSRLAERTEAQLADVIEQMRRTDATVRSLAQEQIDHRDATSTILVASVQRVERELVAELRETATVRELVEALRCATDASEGGASAHDAPPSSSLRGTVPSSERRATTPAKPGESLLPADAPTPPAGVLIAALLKRDVDVEGAP